MASKIKLHLPRHAIHFFGPAINGLQGESVNIVIGVANIVQRSVSTFPETALLQQFGGHADVQDVAVGLLDLLQAGPAVLG